MTEMKPIATAIALAAALSFAASTTVFAQPKEGCEDATPGETGASADASEQVADYVEDPGCDIGHLTDETMVEAEAQDEGSHAPESGVGSTDQ